MRHCERLAAADKNNNIDPHDFIVIDLNIQASLFLAPVVRRKNVAMRPEFAVLVILIISIR